VATIVVPHRRGKTRLRHPARADLAAAMLADVLAACRPVGPTGVADAPGGQGAAVAAVLAALDEEEPVLIVNSDLPCATEADIRALLAAVPGHGFVLVEAADGTTNALGLSSPALFEPLYGAGSASRFKALGAARSLDLPNLADDVDTVADLERLAGRLGPATRAALARLGVAA
jgi:2-phospho-L-lactate guanylyltransferase (CobY/MobA/RfbA family)